MISTRWLANPDWGHSHFPHYFWSSCDYLINLINFWKWKFSSSLNGHIDHPIILTIESRIAIIFWTCSPFSFNYMSFWYHFWRHTNHISLKYRCPNKQVTDVGLSTLVAALGTSLVYRNNDELINWNVTADDNEKSEFTWIFGMTYALKCC